MTLGEPLGAGRTRVLEGEVSLRENGRYDAVGFGHLPIMSRSVGPPVEST